MSLVTNKGKHFIATQNVAAANLYVHLIKPDYTPTANVNFVSEFAANVVSVSGYAHQPLASVAVVEDDTNGFAFLFADPVTFATLAAGQNVAKAVVYNSTGDNTTSVAIGFYDVTETPTNGGSVQINWAANSAGSVLKLS